MSINENTQQQIEFFRLIASGDLRAIRDSVARDPALISAFNYQSFGGTPLTMACFANRPAVVELLLELGADPNQKSDWAMGPWSPLHCAVSRGDLALGKHLLEHGAVMDVHTAAGLGDCEAVARLLDSDPTRVLEPGGDGCHPLHFADTIEVAKLLLARGAAIDGRCLDHYSTPVQYLCTRRPDVACYLLSMGAQADIFSSIACGDLASVEHLLATRPDLINARINQAFFPPAGGHDVHNILTFTLGMDITPLHAAARVNRGDAVSLLAGKGLPVDERGGYDQGTPLHTAAWHNSTAAAESLLACQADIEARSGKIHNNTPAGWAIVAGAADVFEFLLEHGAKCYPWFLDDALDGCSGRFDPVTNASPVQRQRILARLSR